MTYTTTITGEGAKCLATVTNVDGVSTWADSFNELDLRVREAIAVTRQALKAIDESKKPPKETNTMLITGNSCTVTAVKWDNGWDLYLDDDNVTSVTYLKDAQQQVRDYLDTVNPTQDHSNIIVDVTVDLDNVQEEIESAKASIENAARQQTEAAQRIRKVVKTLQDKGVSSEDTATLLGVSRSRVYQLRSTHQQVAI